MLQAFPMHILSEKYNNQVQAQDSNETSFPELVLAFQCSLK